MYRLSAKLIVMLAALLLAASANANETELLKRLEALERDYVELLIRDREKDQEIKRLREALEALRRGERIPAATHADGQPQDRASKPSHDHGHGHDHAQAHDHGVESHGYDAVILETEDIIVYTPSIGFDIAVYGDDSKRALESRLEDLAGFGGGHGHEEEGEEHGHETLGDGFNLRHAELGLALELKGFARGQVLLNASPDGVEAEEAFIKSVPVADLVTLKGGLFRSGFGFFNERHSPEWDFADMPLAHFAIFGDHGLDGVGAQVAFVPSGSRISAGVEVFNGDGEQLFSSLDDFDDLNDIDEPSVVIAWLNGNVVDGPYGRLTLGLAGGLGRHEQELAHLEEEEEEDEEEEEERFGRGQGWFVSPGFEFFRDGGGERLQGDVTLRGEYIFRVKDLELVGEAGGYEAMQDGYYVEGLYGLTESLQAGLRWEQLGLVNRIRDAGEDRSFGSSYRMGGVLSYWLTDWAQLALQLNYGSYQFEEGTDDVLQALMRFTMQLGPHLH